MCVIKSEFYSLPDSVEGTQIILKSEMLLTFFVTLAGVSLILLLHVLHLWTGTEMVLFCLVLRDRMHFLLNFLLNAEKCES